MNAKRTVDPRVDRICAELATVRAEYRTVRNELASRITEHERFCAERDSLNELVDKLQAQRAEECASLSARIDTARAERDVLAKVLRDSLRAMERMDSLLPKPTGSDRKCAEREIFQAHAVLAKVPLVEPSNSDIHHNLISPTADDFEREANNIAFLSGGETEATRLLRFSAFLVRFKTPGRS